MRYRLGALGKAGMQTSVRYTILVGLAEADVMADLQSAKLALSNSHRLMSLRTREDGRFRVAFYYY